MQYTGLVDVCVCVSACVTTALKETSQAHLLYIFTVKMMECAQIEIEIGRHMAYGESFLWANLFVTYSISLRRIDLDGSTQNAQ